MNVKSSVRTLNKQQKLIQIILKKSENKDDFLKKWLNAQRKRNVLSILLKFSKQALFPNVYVQCIL